MGTTILSKNAKSLNGKLIDAVAPADGQVLAYLASSGKYVPTTIPTHALVSGNGTTYATDRYNLGGTLTAPAIITDSRGTPTGIEYGGDYSANYTARSLVDKSYVDTVVASAKAYQGGYNATTGSPDLSAGGLGPTIKAGEVWDVTVAGTFYGETVEVGDTLTARIDAPTVLGDWVILQTNLTAASVKTMYESNANTNAYTDAAQTKVDYLTVTGAINLDAIPNGNLADMAQHTIKGRYSAGSGSPEDIAFNDLPSNLPKSGDKAFGWTSGGVLTEFVMAKLLNTMSLGTTTSGASTPDISSSSCYYLTAQAQPIIVNAPIGTPDNTQELEFRFKDDGTARAITWNAAYTSPTGASLPTTTVVGETMYLRFLYNSTTTKWEMTNSSVGAGGSTDADAIHDNVDGEIAAITAKATPVNADVLLIEDSAASNAKKKVTFENLKNTINASGKPSLAKTITIEEPTASEDITLFYTDVAITIQEIRAVSTGTTPSTTYQVKTSSLDRSGAGTNITSSGATTSKTLGDTASVTTAAVPSGSWIWLVTTAASGTSVGLTVNIRYTED